MRGGLAQEALPVSGGARRAVHALDCPDIGI